VLDLQAELQPDTILEDDPTSPVCKWDDKEWRECGYQSTKWRLSQFVHGEWGAMLCTVRIVETVPWIDVDQGWLREKFTEIGVIEFGHMPETGAVLIDYGINEDGFEERSADMHSAAADVAMGAGES
jgi:hypothetical protein